MDESMNQEGISDALAWRGCQHFYYLREPTDELLDKIKLINIRRRIKSIDWSKVDDDIVEDVWKLVRM